MLTSYQITLGDGYIMAVEDSHVQAKRLQHFFDENNLTTIVYSKAMDAYTAALEKSPVLIISDIMMPGMDGYEFCSKIKAHPVLKEVPVILLTSLRDPLDIIKGLQAGADNFITKPYDEMYLLSRIHYLLANREMRKSGSAEMMIEIMFRGNRYAINSEKKQILDLLLSVYEAAIQRNDELISTQAKLEASNENLVAANEELEAFSFTVSHDLRNPLNVIGGYSQILQQDYSKQLDAEAIEFLERIQQATVSMATLIDDLLQFSRSGRSEIILKPIDLSGLARSIMEDLENHSPQSKPRVFIQEGLNINADPGLIHVVLENLLSNALKYSGKIPNPEITFGQLKSENENIFFVKDNGAGFDMSKAAKLFNPFQRLHTSREFQGTGVGLATVRRIIERHGGRVWAESEPGKGATFYFAL
ncbi:MAG: ATP-binding protein [Bacteroidales bacterium]